MSTIQPNPQDTAAEATLVGTRSDSNLDQLNQPPHDQSIFHLFPKLAIELRLAIWEESVLQNQTQVLTVKLRQPLPTELVTVVCDFAGTTPPHAMHHVNREAKAVFETMTPYFLDQGLGPRLRFSPSDTILFWTDNNIHHPIWTNPNLTANFLLGSRLTGVDHIAIEYRVVHGDRTIISFGILGLRNFLQHFPSLEKVICAERSFLPRLSPSIVTRRQFRFAPPYSRSYERYCASYDTFLDPRGLHWQCESLSRVS